MEVLVNSRNRVPLLLLFLFSEEREKGKTWKDSCRSDRRTGFVRSSFAHRSRKIHLLLLDLVTFYVFAPLHSSSIAGFFPEPHSTYYPLISNGPFKLCHWSPNVELVMDKNPHYYRAKEIYFERIRLNYLVNDLRVIDHFLQRDIDLVVKRFKILFKHKAIKLLVNTNDMNSIHLSDTCCCVFNCIDPVFRNKDLRRALSMGIDRPKLLQRLTMMGEDC